MSTVDLEDTIEDAVNDSVAPDPVDTPDTSTETSDAPTPESAEVINPATAEAPLTDEVADEFARKFGVAGQSVTGKENRIPYSRVKAIVAKAEKDAVARARKDLEGTVNPKVTEYEAKVQDYESRLGRVAQFEQILENDPKAFLGMLSKIPAYSGFFGFLNDLASKQAGGGSPQRAPLDPSMPKPDQQLSDGSTVYSEEGLQNLLEWQAQKIEARVSQQVTQQVQQRYAPIEQQWQSQQHMARVVPIIQKQIADARTWPLFNENEAEVLATLKADPNISLEGAYRKAVYPRIQASRDDMRKSILEELRTKPVSTSAPTSASRPGQQHAGNQSLEEIIAAAAATLK